MMQRLGPYGVSVLLHLALLLLLGVSLHTPVPPLRPTSAPAQAEPIQAVAVDDAKVRAEVERLKSEQRQRKQQDEVQRRQLQDEARQAREAREREEQRLADLKKQADARQAREAAEQKRLADLKKQQEALAQKQAAEQKRLADLEAKRKGEEAKARQADEDRKRKAAEQALQEKLAAAAKQMQEEQAQQAARSQANVKYKAQYVADIQNRVRRNWLRPVGSTQEFQCKVLVQQMPTGDVISVQITKSCGSPVLDRSVENAVRKSSPLPPPPVPEVWDREIEFTFSST